MSLLLITLNENNENNENKENNYSNVSPSVSSSSNIPVVMSPRG